MTKQAGLSVASILFTILYIAVHFIPDLGGADVMGAQWLYSSILDAIVLLYILLNRKRYTEAITAVFKYRFTILFSLLLFWAIGSYAYAINRTETLVTLARLITTYLIFINLSILYYQKNPNQIFDFVSYVICFVLLYDAIFVLKGFSSNLENMTLDQNIISLMGNHGNKNVMAASLLFKFPFVLWLMLTQKIIGKVVGWITLYLGVVALLILNTRSTYVGLATIFIIFTLTSIYFKNRNNSKSIVKQVALFLIPILLGFLSANLILENAVQIQGGQGGYGTVTKRIGDITVASEQNSRIHLWKGAIDYAIHHPLFGAGYGNWKLASIPYEKEYTNDLFVPYHSHNDFLEMFADLGLIGGLCFAGMFLILLWNTIRIWKNKEASELHLFATIAFMAITCYAIDALLNFPAERTAMQTLLALGAALVSLPLVYHYGASKNTKNTTIPTNTKQSNTSLLNLLYFVVGFGLILPSIYIAKLTYDSLKVQKYVMGEIDADPKMPLEEVKDAFPSIPNLSTSTLPIPALVARYYFRDKQYDEALKLLKESDEVNPYLHYNDFIRTAVYASKQNYDSVFYFAHKAFYNWPRATSYYKNMMFAAAKKKDTLEIQKAFDLYKKYRPSGEAWNQYLLAMYEVKGGADPRLVNLLDSAIKTYPQDSAIFVNTVNIYARSGSIGLKNNVIADFAAQGAIAFQKGQYEKAGGLYLKATAIDPANYTHWENAGICNYTAKQFSKAIECFQRASQFATATSGKSEFFMAMSYIALGKKEQACPVLQQAKRKNYPGVDAYIQQNCK